MQSKEIIKGKWKIEVSVGVYYKTKGYGHKLNVYRINKEYVGENKEAWLTSFIPVSSFTIFSNRKKLDPYMWIECYEAFTYHKPSMDIKEWEEIIRELDAQK